jgi:hypothetical protein
VGTRTALVAYAIVAIVWVAFLIWLLRNPRAEVEPVVPDEPIVFWDEPQPECPEGFGDVTILSSYKIEYTVSCAVILAAPETLYRWNEAERDYLPVQG